MLRDATTRLSDSSWLRSASGLTDRPTPFHILQELNRRQGLGPYGAGARRWLCIWYWILVLVLGAGWTLPWPPWVHPPCTTPGYTYRMSPLATRCSWCQAGYKVCYGLKTGTA